MEADTDLYPQPDASEAMRGMSQSGDLSSGIQAQNAKQSAISVNAAPRYAMAVAMRLQFPTMSQTNGRKWPTQEFPPASCAAIRVGSGSTMSAAPLVPVTTT